MGKTTTVLSLDAYSGIKTVEKVYHPISKKADQLLDLNKSDIRMVVGLPTSHFLVKHILKAIGKAEDDLYRSCSNATETAEHLLYAQLISVRG